MRLRYLEKSQWSIVEEAGESGESPLLDLLEDQAGSRRADVSGMITLFERAAIAGPRALPKTLVHEAGEGIWEFVKGKLRVLFFEVDGRLVVCSHAFRKKTQQTPSRERDKAIRLRQRYEAARLGGTLEFIENEDGE